MSSSRRDHHAPSAYCDFFIRFENRNSEETHNEALAAAYAERRRIYEEAVRVQHLEELRQEQLRFQEEVRQKEERVRLEEERVREQIRLREIENRAKAIPQVPDRAPTPPLSAPAQKAGSTTLRVPDKAPPPSAPAQKAGSTTPQVPVKAPTPPPSAPAQQPVATSLLAQSPSQVSNPFAQQPSQASNPFAQPSQPSAPLATAVHPAQAEPRQPAQLAQSHSSAPQSNPYLHPAAGAYVEIHQRLSQLRAAVTNAAEANKRFKNELGDLRRSLRMAIGQIVKDKSKNRGPVST
jgi:nucleoporin GLE1